MANPTPITILESVSDYTSFQTNHQTVSAGADTTVTFSQTVRMIRISNWDTANFVLVKNAAILSAADSTASRIGFAPTANSGIYAVLTGTTTYAIGYSLG